MSELGPSSFEQPRSMDSPGRNADMPFGNQEVYGRGVDPLGRKSEPAPPQDPIKRELFDRFGPDYDEGDIDYDDLPDYGADTGHIDTEFFADPDQNAEHLEAASAEVRHSIHQIEATETIIAQNTGEHDQELVDSVDRFLVDHAEHAVDIDASDKADIVETALIEGALEVTGDRKEATENPILKLEKDGYDQQVTEGVKKLHEEGATLPDGESAAEVVANIVDEYEKQAGQTERLAAGDQRDAAVQQYMQGASKEDVLQKTGMNPAELTNVIRNLPPETQEYLKDMRKKSLGENAAAESQEVSQFSNTELESAFVYGIQEDSGMSQEQVDTWYNSLPEDQQQYFAEGKREMSQQAEQVHELEARVEANLETSAPELLEGRLPKELADRIGSEYVIGLRQLGSDEASEAQEKLAADGGVDVANLSLTQSFNVIKETDDDWTTKGTVIRGYYGVQGGGKFVIAVPLHGADSPTTAYESVPDMQQELRTRSDPNHRAVNPKYVAGFIDGEGVFHPNENFMRSNEAKLSGESAPSTPMVEAVEPQESTNPYEKLSVEQLTAVRDNIADSIVQGIRKYDPADVIRASANLAAIQREIQARSPEQATRQRGEVDGAVTYITEPDTAVIQKIVSELQKIDGAPNIARKLYGGLEIPASSEENQEARLQAMELQSLLASVSREIRNVTGSEFSESTNPYASMKNEELSVTVDRLKQTIQDLTAQGADTTEYRNRLAQAGQIINARR